MEKRYIIEYKYRLIAMWMYVCIMNSEEHFSEQKTLAQPPNFRSDSIQATFPPSCMSVPDG